MNLYVLLSELGRGMLISIEIFVLTLIISLPLGLVIALGRMAKQPVLRVFFKIYISIMRGTPLMLQLMVVYFGPYYLFGISLSRDYRFWAVIIGFGLNYAAYFAEIYRGGIESMPVGQYEAAKLLGYGKAQTFLESFFPRLSSGLYLRLQMKSLPLSRIRLLPLLSQ